MKKTKIVHTTMHIDYKFNKVSEFFIFFEGIAQRWKEDN